MSAPITVRVVRAEGEVDIEAWARMVAEEVIRLELGEQFLRALTCGAPEEARATIVP